MICPSCKTRETSIISDKLDKKTNSVKRKRYCACGNQFSTFEKCEKSKIKRKSRNDSVWKSMRFIIYADYRMRAAFESSSKLKKIVISDIKSSSKLNKIVDINTLKMLPLKTEGKSYWAFGQPNKKKIVISKIEKKKETINKIVRMKYYWILRNHYLSLKHKQLIDINKDRIRKEAQELYKSVCTYIKDTQYNQDFFTKFALTDQKKIFWKEKDYWDIWLTVR